jgi:hypothetical protein
MRYHAAAAFLPPALCLALIAFACSESTSNPVTLTESGADAAFDSGYGGVFVVPSMAGDGDGGSATGYGGTDYGASPDSAHAPPCPADSAADMTDNDAEDVDAENDVESGSADAECSGPLAPGDLVVDELMIASQSGTGDHGEWVEVTSTRSCTIDLNGLYAEVPHGQGTTTAHVTSDLLLPPYAAFLVADSSSAVQNHNLPGMIVTWGAGTSSDVLKNSGDTITLFTATTTIDTLTYTATSKLIDGASMAFPSNCEPSLRTDFHNWQASLASWTPGFFGTPGAPNTDVSCAIQPPSPPPSASPCSGSAGGTTPGKD